MSDSTFESVASDQATLQPAIVWLNMTGDVTITWDESSKEKILELVRSKMAQGYSFFVLKPRALPILGNKKVKLTKEKQLDKAVGIVVPDSQAAAILARLNDDAVEAVVSSGHAQIVQAPKASLESTHRAKSAEEVVRHRCAAVRPVVGG